MLIPSNKQKANSEIKFLIAGYSHSFQGVGKIEDNKNNKEIPWNLYQFR